jgi:hypothetical protein
MPRPAPKSSGLTKAPRKEHPVAPDQPTKASAPPQEREPRLSVEIPAALHRDFKAAVAQQGTSMRAATIEALTEYVNKNR